MTTFYHAGLCGIMFQCIQGTAHFPLDMMFCAESEARSDLLQAVLATLQLKWQLNTHRDKFLALPRVYFLSLSTPSDRKKRKKRNNWNMLHGL